MNYIHEEYAEVSIVYNESRYTESVIYAFKLVLTLSYAAYKFLSACKTREKPMDFLS